jgi:NAD(P)H-hydrate epimerase
VTELTNAAVTVERMQRIDAAAIERLGIPRLLLMEHAGMAVARAARRFLSAVPGSAQTGRSARTRVLVCCGMGFNGGDGLAAARHLHAWGASVRVLLAGRVARLREEPALYARILRRLRVPLAEVTDQRHVAQAGRAFGASDGGVLIDALLGIGARGAVREPMATLIAWMNRRRAPVIAADIPSGLDGDTGIIQGIAVKATVTVAFGLPKRGCLRRDGPAHVGTLVVDPITLPPHLLRTR